MMKKESICKWLSLRYRRSMKVNYTSVNSGSEVHGIPFKLVKQYVEEMKSETSLLLRGA